MKKILCLLLFTQCCMAQFRTAKILFDDGETIEGFAEIRKNKIYFKVGEEEPVSEWTFNDAKGVDFIGYGFSEKYVYVKFKEKKDPEIMEVIDEGAITLYRKFRDKFNIGALLTGPDADTAFGKNNYANGESYTKTVEEYYVGREGQAICEKATDGFGRIRKELFSGCSFVLEKIVSKEFTIKNIEELVGYYNDYCEEGTDKD